MSQGYRIPLILEPQLEGEYTVTSPAIPELITEGDTVEEALANVRDAFAVVREIYEDAGRELPQGIRQELDDGPIQTEQIASA